MLKENIDCNAYDFNQIDGQSLLMVILIIFNFFLTKPYNIIEFEERIGKTIEVFAFLQHRGGGRGEAGWGLWTSPHAPAPTQS
jgi:hypothetical protein